MRPGRARVPRPAPRLRRRDAACGGHGPLPHRLTPGQRRVLIALCRPLVDTAYGVPATNKEIAAELSLSVEAVKTHLRRASELLGLEHLPQNEKRAKLAGTALAEGLVTPRDLLREL